VAAAYYKVSQLVKAPVSRSEGAATMGMVVLPSLSSRAYLRIAQVALAVCVLNILSGATVRLTDSGLGCADWPNCTKSSVTPPLSFHPIMEFANRMVVALLVVVVAVAFLGAFRRAQRRKDLVFLSGGLVAGVIGEAVVGAVVVYSKLNPYIVMVHFLLGIALVGLALALAIRAGRADVASTTKVSQNARRVALAMVGVLVVALCAGTATTGAGPHAGGPGAKRIPIPLADMARTHSSIVLILGALTLFELWLLHREGAPTSVMERGQALLAVMIAQGVIGYTQYFTHEPALLVGIHVAGAVSVWLMMLWFYDGLSHHPAETSPSVGPAEDAATGPTGTEPEELGRTGIEPGVLSGTPGQARVDPGVVGVVR
jgi:cytochrome c oxidase assembly protein subunit 15